MKKEKGKDSSSNGEDSPPYQKMDMNNHKTTPSKLSLSISDDRYNIDNEDHVVLIVEDDFFFSKILLNSVREKGFKGVVANRGDLVLIYIEKYRPKAILLDIKLPKKDGWTILQQLKSNEKYIDIPVHIISGVNKPKKGLEMGAIEYLVKPISPQQLSNTLNKISKTIKDSLSKVLIIGERPIDITFDKEKSVAIIVAKNAKEATKVLLKESSAIDCIIVDVAIAENKKLLDQIQIHHKHQAIPKIMVGGDDILKGKWNLAKRYIPLKKMIKNDKYIQKHIGDTNSFLQQLIKHQNPPSYIKHSLLNGKKILIVGDNTIDMYTLSGILEQHKSIVIMVSNGMEAINYLNEEYDIDLLLMDLEILKINASYLIQYIKTIPKFKDLQIALLNAKHSSINEKGNLEGINYLYKPILIDEVVPKMINWLA